MSGTPNQASGDGEINFLDMEWDDSFDSQPLEARAPEEHSDFPELDEMDQGAPRDSAQSISGNSEPSASMAETAPAQPAQSKGGGNGLIVVVVAVMVLMLGGLAYFAVPLVLGSSPQQEPSQLQSGQFGFEAPAQSSPQVTASSPSREQLVSSDDLLAALDAPPAEQSAVSPELAEAPPQHSAARQDLREVVSERNENGARILVSDGGSVALSEEEPDQVVAKVPSPAADPSQVKVSEEDAIYDQVLDTAAAMDLPAEAIKIDHSVIQQRLERKRIDNLEATITSYRADLGEMRNMVSGIQGEVTRLSSAIEKEQQSQAANTQAIASLGKAVETLAKQQERELAKLRADVASAVRAPAQRPAASVQRPAEPRAVQQQQRAPAVAASPAPSHAAPAVPAVATLPRPQPAVTVVAPVAAQEQQSQSCSGRPVSRNWRIKGINSSSAYIVRSEDNEGMFIKAGSEVPGFGTAESFDRINRFVCTSMGMIRR